MEDKIEAIKILFILFYSHFVKELKDSTLVKALTDKEINELREIVGRSISQTITDMFDKCNEEKIEGDRKDA